MRGRISTVRRPIMIMLGVLPLLAAPASAMTVAEYLAKARALRASGAAAMFSSDLGVLRAESEKVGRELREQRLRDRKAGRSPAYCPPGDTSTLTPTELVSGLAAIPAPQRNISVRDGFARVLARRYPCR